MNTEIKTISDTSLQINEDILGCNSKAIWVLDGATSISSRKIKIDNQLESDASWFVKQFSKKFSNLDSDIDLNRKIKSITDNIRFIAPSVWDDWDDWDIPSASFSAAFYNNNEISLYNLGDCKIFYQLDNGSIQMFGQSNVEQLDQNLLEHYKLLRLENSDLSHKDIWKKLVSKIRENRLRMNQPDGYWILSPDGVGINHLQKNKLNYQKNARILITSDGLYRLVDTYKIMSSKDFFEEAFKKNGLNKLIVQLRDIEDNDPEAYQYPRVKLQDDATATLININL